MIIKGREGLLGRDATDYRGFYSIQLHLHNDDLGKKLTVQAGDRKATSTSHFHDTGAGLKAVQVSLH